MSEKIAESIDSIAESLLLLTDNGGESLADNIKRLSNSGFAIAESIWPGGTSSDPATGIAVGSLGESVATIAQALCRIADAIKDHADVMDGVKQVLIDLKS